MKKITKLFISLSAILAISYSATTTATQINVTTRNPRGSLRLNQLYMKNGNTTGIHLDGTHQTLKVGHANQSGVTLSGASKVLTNQICDANGEICLNIHDLNAGENNGNLDIEGSHGQRCRYDCEGNDMERMWLQMYHEYCYNKPENQCNEAKGKFLDICTNKGFTTNQCNQIMTSQQQCKIVCDQDMPTIPTIGNGKITIKQGGTEKGYFYLNSNGGTTINLDAGGGGGLATVNGNNDYICVKSGSNLSCSKAKLGTLNDGKRCTYNSSSKTIDCNSNPPAGGGNGNSNTIQPLTIQGNGTAVTQFDGSSAKTLNIVAGNNITITTGNNQIKISANNGAGLGNLDPTSSDSLRQKGSFTYGPANKETNVDYVTPKDSRVIYLSQSRPNIYFGDGTQNSKLRFLNYGTNRYVTVAAEIRPNGAIFGNIDSALWLQNLHGVSVAGYLIVGNSGQNYISIYSTGTTSSNDRHYEIMASKELAVGTYSGAFIYFKNHSNGNDYKQYRVGINNKEPKATLDVAGSIRINTEGNKVCAPSNCKLETAGTIIYRDNKFYGCMSKDGTTYKRYEFTMSSNIASTRNQNCDAQPSVPAIHYDD